MKKPSLEQLLEAADYLAQQITKEHGDMMGLRMHGEALIAVSELYYVVSDSLWEDEYIQAELTTTQDVSALIAAFVINTKEQQMTAFDYALAAIKVVA